MDFVDRAEELGRLDRLMAAPGGGLAVIWGRRRIGKTRLLLEWVRTHQGLYWVADLSAAPQQRANLAEMLATRLPGFAQVAYPDFGVLLSRLAREAKQARWRGPLVMDELPYLIDAAPELPATLQRFIDHEAKNAGLVVALAGSSQRMMQGLTLSPSAPLYGRAQQLLKLGPLPAGYIAEAFGERDAAQSVRAYALWGGVPRYWELAEPFEDLRAAVDSLALDPRGVLHDEPTRLLLEETPPAIALRPILDAIGAGVHRVSEIGGRIGQPATSLARPITRLLELDLIVREIPFGEPVRSSKRALYKLADPFLRFWFTLVAPKRSLLAQLPRAARLRLFNQVAPRLASAAWEDLCRQAVPLLSERLGALEWGTASRYWSSNGPEWDVVAESLDGAALLLGEVKWIDGEPSRSAVEQAVGALRAKGVPSLARAAQTELHHVVFVSRLPPRQPRVVDGVYIVDARDILEVLR